MLAASTPVEAAAPQSATARIDLLYYRPAAARDCAAFEARLRALVAELAGRARLVIAARAARAVPAGVYLSPSVPTLVVIADGRLLAQAVGELPRRELRALIEGALGRCGG
jgi:thioredoxin-like negative regulator of GroEL